MTLVCLLPIPFVAQVAMALLLVFLGIRDWRRLQSARIDCGRLDDQGGWTSADVPNRQHIVQASCDLLAIRLGLSGHPGRTILIMRDAVDASTYHELSSRIAQHRLPVEQGQ